MNELIEGGFGDGTPANRGSSNNFYVLDRTPDMERRIATTTSNGWPGNIGLRVNKTWFVWDFDDESGQQTLLLGWEELWCTLHAASMGLHPRVFMAGLTLKSMIETRTSRMWVGEREVVTTRARMAYVTARYESLASAMLFTRTDREWGMAHASELDDLIRDISIAGFIHTDIKPLNVVIDESRSTGRLFMIIDMGADYLRFERNGETSTECIWLINALLMIITTFCNGNASVGAIALTSVLRVSLNNMHRTFQAELSASNNSPGGQWKLCHEFAELFLSDAKRVDKYNSSFYREDDYLALAKAVLDRAEHYGKLDDDSGFKCATTEDWTAIFRANPDMRAYDLLRRIIRERMVQQSVQTTARGITRLDQSLS